ncbi:hypothetical protein MBLNU459_g0128t1 [Dothideomycetes sp. NU459]
MADPTAIREWRRTQHGAHYLISTDPTLLSHTFINRAFSTPDMYWAKSLPAADLRTLLATSQTLGLYLQLPAGMSSSATASNPSSPRAASPTVEEPESPSMDAPDAAFAAATARAATPPPAAAAAVGPGNVQMVGLARFVTDHVTTLYLTDVYVLPEHRGGGLGKWLIACCNEVIDSTPHLRRAILMASPDEGKKFYNKALAMHDLDDEREHCVAMTRRGFKFD